MPEEDLSDFYVAIFGHLEVGLRAVGPFKTKQDAMKFINRLTSAGGPFGGMPVTTLRIYEPNAFARAILGVSNDDQDDRVQQS